LSRLLRHNRLERLKIRGILDEIELLPVRKRKWDPRAVSVYLVIVVIFLVAVLGVYLASHA
jgi:hypothetical protein